MVLVLGMAVIGCGDDSEPNPWDEVNFNTTDPSGSTLSTYGINNDEFNTIKSAGGGGYQGWAILGDDLVLYWTGRSMSNYNTVVTALETKFSSATKIEDDGVHIAGNVDDFIVMYYESSNSSEGYTTPAGTMIAGIMPN